MFGVSRPMNESLAPSVPPRIARRTGSMPILRTASKATSRTFGSSAILYAMLRYDSLTSTEIAGAGVGLAHLADDRPQRVLARDQLLLGEGAHEELDLDPGDVAAEVVRVQVGLAQLGGLGQELPRQPLHDRGRHAHGVDELALGVPGVDVVPLDDHERRVRAERLVLDLGDVRAVEGVGVSGAERRDVEVLGAPPDLLVGRERDAERAGGRTRGASRATRRRS